jgi:hypothetical protein
MADEVFYSTIWTNTAIYSDLMAFFSSNDFTKAGKAKDPLYTHCLKSAGKTSRGEKLTADELPPCLFGEIGFFIDSLPQVFYANGYFVLREQAYDVFSQFDLGETELVPVKVYQSDKETEVAGAYYLINFGCVKNSFIPEMSTDLRPPLKVWFGMAWTPPLTPKDDQVAVSVEKSRGSHLWHEKWFMRSLFMSGQLRNALVASSLDKPFKLSKCRMVGV